MAPTRIITCWIAFFFLLSKPMNMQTPSPFEGISDPYMLSKAKEIWRTIEQSHRSNPWEVVNEVNRDVGMVVEENLKHDIPKRVIKEDKEQRQKEKQLEHMEKQRAKEQHHKEKELHHQEKQRAKEQHHIEKELQHEEKERDKLMARERKKYKGQCIATNPVDKCWRCDKNWEQNRQRLADCAIGFGKGTTGGKGGRYYVVTDYSDNELVDPKPGTLRHAIIQEEPLWIIFGDKMVNIKLKEELIMTTSNKTIDARGSAVRITGAGGITIQYVTNVIIHGVHIKRIVPGKGKVKIRDSIRHYGYRAESDGDCIGLYAASHVWIDHVSLARCSDGMIDVVEGSTAVSITNTHMSDHNDVLLFGAKNGKAYDKMMQITLAFNHFGKNLTQRMPRGRWGFFHMVNNDYTHWTMYAVGGSQNPTLLSHGNRYIAINNVSLKEVTKREYTDKSVWKTWTWRSDQDLFLNGAFFRQSGVHPPQLTVKPQSGKHVNHLTRFSGPLKCVAGAPC